MKFIAYILIAANVAFAAYYFSTKSDTPTQTNQTAAKATMSNLTYTQPSQAKPVAQITQPKPKPAVVKPVIAKPVIEQKAVCYEISQIIEPETKNKIQSILNTNQITHSLREQESLIKTEYWILIGPFSSTNRTKLEVSNLKKASVDHYIRGNEPYTGAISLGLYSGQSNAQSEIKRINAKGFDSRLEIREIFKTLYFFDLPSHSSVKLTDDVWNALLKSDSSIKKSKKDC